jgi:hypothetical protein
MSLPRSVHTDTAVGRVIQTRYANRFFRSRTEARWAVLFDALGVRWEYEIEGYVLRDGTRYLPDFYIHEWDAWFEVKPTTDRQFAHSHVHTLSMLRRVTHAKNAYVAFGAPDLIRGSYIVNDCCVFTHVDVLGPTHRAPEDGIAYEAYRRAMEERFESPHRKLA